MTVVHYRDSLGYTACGGVIDPPWNSTTDRQRISCTRCRNIVEDRYERVNRAMAIAEQRVGLTVDRPHNLKMPLSESTPQPKPRKRHLDAATAAFIIFLAIVLVVAIGALVLFYNADILGQFRWGDLAIWGCVIGAAILLRREIRKWMSKSDSETNK